MYTVYTHALMYALTPFDWCSLDEEDEDLAAIDSAPDEIKKWLTSTFAKQDNASSFRIIYWLPYIPPRPGDFR